ncbi:MAG: tRNA (guanosine(37)-N1)-methyltransferase TrmD [Chlamydiae bacterium]|nr:tRNA (guanosine(37)-N1)-methyltransferase TrmD [Chlamydiota bacterium]MBI3266034.1 tRNA (guanosine(37)-N1)-methyltransferase TrmD [Chlamydiota bacterium]
MALKIDIITLFPEMLTGFLCESILKKAQEKGKVEIRLVSPRDFAKDKHKTCDDKPFGGGSGMVMKPEPVFRALEKVETPEAHVILMSPQGEKFVQKKARHLAQKTHLIFICGHYEGIDERISHLADEEISIGDYVLTNGALAAAVVVDAVVRLVPDVLGNPDSALKDSFSNGLLEYPQYTRPRVFREEGVPEILLTGDHQKIEKWRHQQSLEKTKKRRPDLLLSYKNT